jgi:hypothetical protein
MSLSNPTRIALLTENRNIEVLVGIIAACVPTLKSSAERLLRWFGVKIDSTPSGMRYDIQSMNVCSIEKGSSAGDITRNNSDEKHDKVT